MMTGMKLPPHNIDAEEAVIGSLLLGGDINELSLRADDFYAERHQFIYRACLELGDREVSINQITLAEQLNSNSRLSDIGGASYLSHLISICPTSLDMRYYADIVKNLSLSRRLIMVGDAIAGLGYNGDSNAVGNIEKADELLLALRRESSSNTIVTPYDRATVLWDRYSELYKNNKGTAIRSGLSKLDGWLGGGLYNGEFVIVAGRPGMGKTCLLQNMANNISLSGTVLFCSVEMSEESISHRDVAGIVGVPTFVVRRGGYTDELYGDIIGALGQISERKVYLFEDVPLTTDKIMQAGIAMQLRHGLDAIFVDYLGLLDDKDGGENQNIRLGNISRKLKHIARKLNVPVVVAHQLSRALEQRQEKRPQLHDLRESGHLEEDADIVLFIYRDSYYELSETKQSSGVTEIIIGKHRQGESNIIVKVWFDGTHQYYGDLVVAK